MTNRLDALSARESNGKTYWTRVGVAFQSKDGSGWNLLLDAMPAPQDGQFKITLRPPQQQEQQHGGGRRKSAGDDGHFDPTGFRPGDDDIPF